MGDIQKVGIIGSGTMGAGIAQTVVQNGFAALVFDVNESALLRAKTQIDNRLEKLARKNPESTEQFLLAKERLKTTTELVDFNECQLVIEAVPEKLELKTSIFQQLEEICSAKVILATNTSSLSITEIAGRTKHPERVAGFHFFNPAPVMPLVEIVQGLKTAPETILELLEFARQISKTPVVCKDTPGFIVNRVARPFYNEALKIMNEQIASVAQIDRIMKLAGNFKMGPFELQDLIGIDINYATTTSVFESFHGESRFRPHYFQQRMVGSGNLGRKTGGGYFSYDER